MTEQANGNRPTRVGVNSTTVTAFGVSFFLMPSSSIANPCWTSVEVISSLTGLPFCTVISFGSNSNRLAVILISMDVAGVSVCAFANIPAQTMTMQKATGPG